MNLAVDQNSLVELPRMPCLSDQTILAHQQGSAQEEETVLKGSAQAEEAEVEVQVEAVEGAQEVEGT